MPDAPCQQNAAWRRVVGVLPVPVVGAYLIWRAGWTLNLDALWLAVPLLVAEVHGYLTYVLFLVMAWDTRPPPQLPARPGQTVDVFIATYNEPRWVLALTIAGAVAIDYPHRTYVLDDGRRPWVRSLSAALGADYVTRPDNAGAKAGNINHALTQSDGEFICVLDADFVPSRTFIDDLLGYFRDTAVAIVQAPQEFYNTDSFQHVGDGGDWHEQASFYRVIQAGKNRSNSAFWCGSPSMVRRAALADIGGVVTDSITEDLHTSIRLHVRGWRTVYHPFPVARGLAPEDYDAFIAQRLRWARGAMQVIRREWRTRGLSVRQRLSYIASTGTYFDAYRKLALLLVIPAILFTDTLPIATQAEVFLAVWAVQMGIAAAGLVAMGRGTHRVAAIEMFDLLKMFAFILASWELVLRRRLRFVVTPKGGAGARHVHEFLWPMLIVVAAYLAALAVGAMRLADWRITAATPAATIAAMVWAGLILIGLLWLTRRAHQHVTRRRAHRFPVALAGQLIDPGRVVREADGGTRAGSDAVTVSDLTLLGAGLLAPRRYPLGAPLQLELADGRRLAASVRRVTRLADGYRVHVAFDLTTVEAATLARLLAPAVAGHSPQVHADGAPPPRPVGAGLPATAA